MNNHEWLYVYILYSLKDYKLYTGFTKNLKQRIEFHNLGLNTSTKNRRPLILIYSEAFVNEKDARQKEMFYKTGKGREFIKTHLTNTFISKTGRPAVAGS